VYWDFPVLRFVTYWVLHYEHQNSYYIRMQIYITKYYQVFLHTPNFQWYTDIDIKWDFAIRGTAYMWQAQRNSAICINCTGDTNT
jgi:hypothetical protein